MTNFSILQNLIIPEGDVKQITDARGVVLWSAASWPDDLDTGLEFTSASAFTIASSFQGWDGMIEYCNGNGWEKWDGNEIPSGKTESGQYIYLRGTGNTEFGGFSANHFILNGSNIECNGNIEKLLDYATVIAGEHPTMSQYCYNRLFYGCEALISAPDLPATTLTEYCYLEMFRHCTSLKNAPSLPATTLAEYCYMDMFYFCSNLTGIPNLPATTLVYGCYKSMFEFCEKIKVSSTETDTYTRKYRIPYSGSGRTTSGALDRMFSKTGGTFTGTPTFNTTYYLDSSNTIV